MKTLGIETSSVRGSVALIENGVLVASAEHQDVNRHAEQILDLTTQVFQEASWRPEELDRIAVGVGPGTFTGIRVGLSVGAGLRIGTKAAAVGVVSLQSIAGRVDGYEGALRVVVRDARRSEYFVGIYDGSGCRVTPVIDPQAISQEGAVDQMKKMLDTLGYSQRELVVIGEPLEGLGPVVSPQLFEPDALSTARIGEVLCPERAPLEPLYIRGANATKPVLPSSPLLLPRS